MSGPVFNLSQIDTWDVSGPAWTDEVRPPHCTHSTITPNTEINKLISIWKYGDSARLEVDAVVNRTNNQLSSGDALYQSIVTGAGPRLKEAFVQIGRCEDRQTVLTPGFDLPAKYIIHTVGPTGDDDEELEQTMDSLLSHIDGTRIRSVGMAPFFIENNAFSLPHATQIVLKKVRLFLENPENRAKVDRIIFIVTHPRNFPLFAKITYLFFPIEGITYDDSMTISDIDNLGEEEEEYVDDDDIDDSDDYDDMLQFSDDTYNFYLNQIQNGHSEPEDMPQILEPLQPKIQ